MSDEPELPLHSVSPFMDERNRGTGACATVHYDDQSRQITEVDIDEFLKRLILFDDVILESAAFGELPELLRVFSYEDTLRLVGAVEWDFSTTQLGSVSEKGFGPFGVPLKYSLGRISWADYASQRDRKIDDALRMADLTRKQRNKLEAKIASRLLGPLDIAMPVRDQLDNDVSSSPTALNRTVARYATAAVGKEVSASDFFMAVHVEEPGVYVTKRT